MMKSEWLPVSSAGDIKPELATKLPCVSGVREPRSELVLTLSLTTR